MIPLEQELRRAAPDWPSELCAAVAARGRRVRFADGDALFGPGDAAAAFLAPLSGAVRVEHAGSAGRSMVLYRVGPGDSCVVTAACMLSGAPYQAWGVAEGGLEAVALSPADFRALIAGHAEFRDRALAAFSSRIVELVQVIDELLLRRVDLRLASWLAERAGQSVTATHQALAAELGTAREVVSRILKDFERRGWVSLGRGRIEIIAAGALRDFSAGL